MNETLAKRLAAYSATAGVALACTPDADAQVVYHDFDPDITECGEYYLYFDLDDDGIEDFRLFQAYAPYHCRVDGAQFFHTFSLWLNRHPDASSQNGVARYSIYAWVSRLSSGEVIGPELNFVENALLARAYCPEPALGLWAGEEGYAGFRFVAGDGRLHYGWIRLSVTDCPMYPALYEYAYKLRPGIPILAGARSAALLDGSVNQTSFPAAGGTLRYTFTVENTTDDPQPLDLWLDADGPAAFTRRLGSGTLPAGANVTRTVSVRVPASAPAGEYDVRFKLGRFATERFITFERYAITKEAAAGVAPGGDEAFAVEPLEGDLFTDADAAPALPGTHALTAPVPNPTDDRTAFTLAVAEAQHVAVTVHDALGRVVARLHGGTLGAGAEHQLVFDGAGLPAGVYAVRAVGETFSDTRVFTLAR